MKNRGKKARKKYRSRSVSPDGGNLTFQRKGRENLAMPATLGLWRKEFKIIIFRCNFVHTIIEVG